MNISMEGLDDRVYGFSDYELLTNLPPHGGVCTTAGDKGNLFISEQLLYQHLV